MTDFNAQEFPPTERFVIERRLGHGGMGVVYQAFDKQRNITVALKTLARLDDADALFYLKNEFRALADVKHPNLVVLYDFFSEQKRWFFTMEMVDGVDFLTYVRNAEVRETPLSDSDPSDPSEGGRASSNPAGFDEGRLRLALRQMALGIGALHERGKVHLDLKPRNVLITPADRVVILDFGLATDFTMTRQNLLSTGSRTAFIGTIHYMAPEQIAQLPHMPASDWYQLGVMLYEALTGTLPFNGSTVSAVIRQKSTMEAPPPPPELTHLPQDLVELAMALLRSDPLARPDGASVIRALGGGGDPKALPHAVDRISPVFVGRRSYLGQLDEALQSAKQDRCVAVFVSGASGMGKTALVQEFVSRVRGMDRAVILSGRCYQREFVPFKALDEVIDTITVYLKRKTDREVRELLPGDIGALARVFPTLRRVPALRTLEPLEIADAQALRRRAFDALKNLLARIGRRTTLIVFIDDMQWGDFDSAGLVSHLLRAPGAPAMLFIGAYATEDAERSAFLAELREARARLTPSDAQISDLEVAPLSAAEASDLALAVIGSYDPASRAMIKEVAREAAGSPFFVGELARYVRVHGAEEGSPRAVPANGVQLLDMLLDRIERLPDDARRLLEVVAVASRPIERALATKCAGLDPNDEHVLALLRSSFLVHARVTKGTEGVETYHRSVQLAVLSKLNAEALRALHLRLASTIEASGQDEPDVLAEHFRAAGENTTAGKYAIAAADRAFAALAFMRAAELYRMALELGAAAPGPAADPQLRYSLLARLGDALTGAGRGQSAAEAYLAAAEGAPRNRALELTHRAAQQLLLSGHLSDGGRVMQGVLRSVNIGFPVSMLGSIASLLALRLRVRLRGLSFAERDPAQIREEDILRADACRSASIGFLFGEPIRALAYSSRFFLLALRIGEPRRIARAMVQEAAYLATVGGTKTKRHVAALRIGRELAHRLEDAYALAFADLSDSAIELALGHFSACYEASKKAYARFRDRCTGVAWEMSSARFMLFTSSFYLGRIGEISPIVRDGVEEARERGDVFSQKVFTTHVAGAVWLAADHVADAQHHVDQSIALAKRLNLPIDDGHVLAEAQIALYSGEGGRAYERICATWKSLGGNMRNQRVRSEMYHLRARCAVASRSGKSAQEDGLRFAALIERERLDWTSGWAKLAVAAVHAQRGEVRRAVELLEQAESTFAGVSMELYRAATRRQRGRLIGGDQGAELIAEADARMAKESIVNPERMSAMLAPGFADR